MWFYDTFLSGPLGNLAYDLSRTVVRRLTTAQASGTNVALASRELRVLRAFDRLEPTNFDSKVHDAELTRSCGTSLQHALEAVEVPRDDALAIIEMSRVRFRSAVEPYLHIYGPTMSARSVAALNCYGFHEYLDRTMS